jgi:hypothetical protein
VRLDSGWVRDADDPAAPLLRLDHLDYTGDSSRASAQAVLAVVDELLACWEAHPPVPALPSAQLHIRTHARDAIGVDPLEVLTWPVEAADLQTCAHAVIRDVVSVPGSGQGLRMSLRIFAHRSEATLRRADPSRIVAVRDAGSCWQWETYPCKPHKHCMAPEFIRTECGAPTQRDDVRVAFGLGPPNAAGLAPPVDVRLVNAAGDVLWLTPLPPELVARYGARYEASDAPAAVLRDGVDTFSLQLGPASITIADAAGRQILDRATGALLASWVAPVVDPAAPTLYFDDGTFESRRAGKPCQGDAGHGHFWGTCGDRTLWFDGHTLAVFADDPPRLVGRAAIGERGVTVRGATVVPEVTLRAGGLRVRIAGHIYLE